MYKKNISGKCMPGKNNQYLITLFNFVCNISVDAIRDSQLKNLATDGL